MLIIDSCFRIWYKKETTDAIQTVIAQYSYALEYSEFRKQVVAVASYAKNSELVLFSQ